MGRSIIISSNSTTFINKNLSDLRIELEISDQNHSDQLHIVVPEGKQSIGVKEMQQLRSWAITKPFKAKNKLGVVYHSELLTIEAQNSILKLLEEPNQSNTFVLVTGNYSKLLPTVISRCELQLDTEDQQVIFELSEFLKGDTMDKFYFITKFDKIKIAAERNQQIEAFLLALVSFFREKLLQSLDNNKAGQSEQIKTNIGLINQTKKMLDAKVPAKNCLEYLIMNLKFP